MPLSKSEITENYLMVVDRIEKAARSAGRNPEDILLVAVTKTQPIEVIQYAIEAGATNFGENYVEEALPKILALLNYQLIKWHMIGHIQSRKAESVCDYFDFAHSLDSVKLAQRLDRFASMLEKTLQVWLELNISGEESKSGWNISNQSRWSDLLPEIEAILSLVNLNIRGVMGIPPYSSSPEASRVYYQNLRKIRDFLIEHFKSIEFFGLSMGMSNDFEVAIQEGSTCVRIGQAIFGPRSL